MKSLLRSCLGLALLTCLVPLQVAAEDGQTGSFEVQSGDRIVLMGNEFADRLRLHGYFEMMLQANYPEQQLSLRNMGWGGDTVTQQLRPNSFGDLHTHLTNRQADMIIVCMGMMESYRGADEVEDFRGQLGRYVEALQAHQYNGESAPRVVLISPIAHENVDPLLPSGEAHNHDLEQYTAAMEQVASEKGLPFVDLYAPTYAWYHQDSSPALTTDGIHLNKLGDLVVSQMMAKQLGLLPADWTPRADLATSESGEQLRQAVVEKDFQFFMRWRALNGEYIYGSRRRQWNMDPEMAQQDEIIARSQQLIWDCLPLAVDELWAE